MISNSLKYMVIGSLLTLVMVAITRPLFPPSEKPEPATLSNNHCTPDTETLAMPAGDIQRTSYPERTQQKSNINLRPHGDFREATPASRTCNLNCIQNLLEKMMLGSQLEQRDFQNSMDNALKVATYLAEHQDQIFTIESSFESLNDAKEREVYLYILSKLPKAQRLQSAQRLARASDANERIAGLSLLESSMGSEHEDVAQELSYLVANETDEKVLTRALKVLDDVPAEQVGSAAELRLSELIEHGPNEKIQATALLAKAKLAKHNDEVKNDIAGALGRDSNTLQFAGLQALDSVLERQNYNPENAKWQRQDEIISKVENIANNTSALLELRIEALNLLRRHFEK